MKSTDTIDIGIVGACGRGRSFKTACDASGQVHIRAVCDINQEGIDEAQTLLGAEEKYTSYETMLEKSDLDAVVIGTPMPLHVPQAITALKEGVHVLSEVPAGISIEECRDLVKACQASKGLYMMAENYNYTRENKLVQAIAEQGLFGEAYYGEGEYLHEVKELNETTPWRRKWQTGINGITYGTHSLGPLLQWMPDDRVVSVACAGSGHHFKDPRGKEYENEDSCVMLGKLKNGGLVKIRVDMLSDRPHSMNIHSLQGTDGVYESPRVPGDIHRIWLRSLSEEMEWTNLEELEKDYLPDQWRNASEEAKAAGHGGGDYFEIMDFIDSITGKRPCPIGIHEAMDMTLPGLVSQESIAQGGKWMLVPDSRDW